MRISDWSSDVCSSDLAGPFRLGLPTSPADLGYALRATGIDEHFVPSLGPRLPPAKELALLPPSVHHCAKTFRADFPRRQEDVRVRLVDQRSEEHTTELQSLMRPPYAVLCFKTQNKT